jgi:hypothetical protein
VCVRDRERQFPSLSQPYQCLAPTHSFRIHQGIQCHCFRRAASMRMHGGAKLNCTSQLRAVFSHSCTMYQQLKFCVQSLLDRLCKHSEFQVRFRREKLGHSLFKTKPVCFSYVSTLSLLPIVCLPSLGLLCGHFNIFIFDAQKGSLLSLYP